VADDGKEVKVVLEPHIFQRGMGPEEASQKLEGLLSGTDLDADLIALGGEEESGSEEEEESTLSNQDEREEEGSEEEEELSLEDEEAWDDAEGEEEEEESLDLYTVKVDGEESEVTLQELLDGYGYQAHNTRKSQQLAEERTTLETETATVRQSKEAYAERLAQVEEALTGMTPEEPDWEKLEKEDPNRFTIEHAKWQRHQSHLAAVAAERVSVRNDQMADYEKQLREYRAAQNQELLKVIPAWKDAEKAKAGAAEISAYAQSLGYSEEEVNGVMDHRAILIMRKSMLYDRSRKAGAEKLKGKPRGASKTLKPGVRRPRGGKATKRILEARRLVRSTGRVQDATDFLKQVLPEDF
jgi:hypothetical protein